MRFPFNLYAWLAATARQTRANPAAFRTAERAFALLVLSAAIVVAFQFATEGRLARPLQPSAGDFFMDLFNTSYWSHRPDMYSGWHAVYPPLNFLLLRTISDRTCYVAGAHAARACDTSLFAFIGLTYFAACVLAYLAFRHRAPGSAHARLVGFSLGLPMLYGLEWSNLILASFVLFASALSLKKTAPLARSMLEAAAINLKPYLVLMLAPRLARGEWRSLTYLVVASVLLYAASVLVLGAGGPMSLLHDLSIYIVEQPRFFAQYSHLSTFGGLVWSWAVAPFVRLGEIIAIAGGLMALWLGRSAEFRPSAALWASLISSEVELHTLAYSGDYMQIFLMFLLFSSLGGSISAERLVLSCCYLLCIPLDLVILSNPSGGAAFTLGQIIRPTLLVAIQAGIALMLFQQLRARRTMNSDFARVAALSAIPARDHPR
jgi:hypothetical protein